MTTDAYTTISAACAFAALLAIIVGFGVSFWRHYQARVLGVSFDSVLPLFANDHHRRDFDTLFERWVEARMWLRKQGRIQVQQAPAVPEMIRRRTLHQQRHPRRARHPSEPTGVHQFRPAIPCEGPPGPEAA